MNTLLSIYVYYYYYYYSAPQVMVKFLNKPWEKRQECKYIYKRMMMNECVSEGASERGRNCLAKTSKYTLNFMHEIVKVLKMGKWEHIYTNHKK